MNISPEGINLIKKYEGFRLQAYLCPGSVWSIGYGHTGGDVFAGRTITEPIAEKLLTDDLKKYELQVNTTVKLPLNQSQFDALVSFTYNCGPGNLKTLIKDRNHEQIADALLLYNKSAGRVLEGLKKRRTAERSLYLSEMPKGSTQQTQDGIIEYSLKRDGNIKISPNFAAKEFKCKDGSDKILVDTDFVKTRLQAIRTHFNAAVTVNSAFRTESYNKRIGGVSKSYHLTGQAFDITVQGKKPEEVSKYAQQLGITGIIQYDSFVHLDSRPAKYWARDSKGVITIKSSFL